MTVTHRTACSCCLTLLILSCVVPSEAAPPAEPVTLVVIDRRPPPVGRLTALDPDASPVTSFEIADIKRNGMPAICDVPKNPPYSVSDLWWYFTCATRTEEGLEARAAAAAAFAEASKLAAAQSSTRAPSRSGDRIIVAVVHSATLLEATAFDTTDPATPGEPPKQNQKPAQRTTVLVQGATYAVTVTEERRASRLEGDLKTFVRLAAMLAPSKFLRTDVLTPIEAIARSCTFAQEPLTWVTSFSYALRLARATVSIEQSGLSGSAVSTLGREPMAPLRREIMPECGGTLHKPSDEVPEEEMLTHIIAEWRKRVAAQTEIREIDKACENMPNESGDPFVILACSLRQEGDDDARVAAAEGLGSLGDRRAIRPLAAVDRPSKVRAAALLALGELEPQGNARAGDTASSAAPPASRASVALQTGPAEHLFLSADVSAGDYKPRDDGDLVPADPAVFYVGVNYLFGDLVRSKQRSPWQGFFLKGMVKGSERPIDSWGIGLGFRDGYGKRFGIDLNLLSPWLAYVGTVAEGGGSRDWRVQYGFSVNLDAALGWLQK